MVAAHRAAAKARKVQEIADGKEGNQKTTVTRQLPQAQGNGNAYLRIRDIPPQVYPYQRVGERAEGHQALKCV